MIGWLARRRHTRKRQEAVSVRECVIELEGDLLNYRLRRSGRRSIAMHVDERGVRVLAPAAMPLASVEGFMRQHAGWLQRRLALWRRREVEQTLQVEDGVRVPVLGQSCRIRVGCEHRRAHWGLNEEGGAELRLPAARAPEQTLERLLRERAREHFVERVAFFCSQLGVEQPPLRLSSARTRWGSCSVRSGIRLNLRLIHLPAELIDYVAAHEVAHLVHMNHSPQFWAVVEGLYPTWRSARKRLNEQGACLPRLAPASQR